MFPGDWIPHDCARWEGITEGIESRHRRERAQYVDQTLVDDNDFNEWGESVIIPQPHPTLSGPHRAHVTLWIQKNNVYYSGVMCSTTVWVLCYKGNSPNLTQFYISDVPPRKQNRDYCACVWQCNGINHYLTVVCEGCLSFHKVHRLFPSTLFSVTVMRSVEPQPTGLSPKHRCGRLWE